MIEKAFQDIIRLFDGDMIGFHKCDTRYHDMQHTLEAVIVTAQIMDGWNKSGNQPPVSQKVFESGIIAALLHDVGYIKRTGDDKGTGAKYTFRHVKRSTEFAEEYLPSLEYNKDVVSSIQKMIWNTCTHSRPPDIKFSSKEEKIASFGLATADLLAQMSADNYLEKLPLLFDEFREAYEYEGKDRLRQKGYRIFETVDKLIEGTPDFYENQVKKRFRDMGSVYELLVFHSGDGRNHYMESLERNLEKIRESSPKELVGQ